MNKEWSELNKTMQAELKKRDSFRRNKTYAGNPVVQD